MCHFYEGLLHLQAKVTGLCQVRWRGFMWILKWPFKTKILFSPTLLLVKSFWMMYSNICLSFCWTLPLNCPPSWNSPKPLRHNSQLGELMRISFQPSSVRRSFPLNATSVHGAINIIYFFQFTFTVYSSRVSIGKKKGEWTSTRSVWLDEVRHQVAVNQVYACILYTDG